jgi:hypothetical protein
MPTLPHEWYNHPYKRKTARVVATVKENTRPTPKGYNQIWTKDEMEFPLNLGIQFRGERNFIYLTRQTRE